MSPLEEERIHHETHEDTKVDKEDKEEEEENHGQIRRGLAPVLTLHPPLSFF